MFSFLSYKLKFRCIFDLLGLKNNKQMFPRIPKIKFTQYGFVAFIDISGICSFNDIEKNIDFIKQYFRAFKIDMYNVRGFVVLDVIINDFDDIPYKKISLPDNQLLIGYDVKGESIIADMYKTPHIGIQGLSNSGKSFMVELLLRNLNNANKYLLNSFKEDFKTCYARRINGDDKILTFLTDLSNSYQNKITYVVIDEVNILNKNKNISKAIENLLSSARHYNIYLICIGQLLLKENCSYKQLFNTRISFKTVDKSSINSFLNTTIEDNNIEQREFYIYSDSLYRGRTYSTIL